MAIRSQSRPFFFFNAAPAPLKKKGGSYRLRLTSPGGQKQIWEGTESILIFHLGGQKCHSKYECVLLCLGLFLVNLICTVSLGLSYLQLEEGSSVFVVSQILFMKRCLYKAILITSFLRMDCFREDKELVIKSRHCYNFHCSLNI